MVRKLSAVGNGLGLVIERPILELLDINSQRARRAATGDVMGPVDVICGTLALFDPSSHKKYGSFTETGLDATSRRAPGAPDQFIVDLNYSDTGDSTREMPFAHIATGRGLASFTRELPQMRVELEITPGSDPVTLVPSR
jgi:hypothetical protein